MSEHGHLSEHDSAEECLAAECGTCAPQPTKDDRPGVDDARIALSRLQTALMSADHPDTRNLSEGLEAVRVLSDYIESLDRLARFSRA